MRKTKKKKARRAKGGGSLCRFSLYIIPLLSCLLSLLPPLSILNASINHCAHHCAPRGRCWYWFSCNITDDLIPKCSSVNVRHYVIHMLCGSHSVLFHPDLFLLFPVTFNHLRVVIFGVGCFGRFYYDDDFSFLIVIRLY